MLLGPGAERLALAGDDQGAHTVVAVNQVEGRHDLCRHQLGKRVQPIWSVQGQRGDLVGHLVADGLKFGPHRRSLPEAIIRDVVAGKAAVGREGPPLPSELAEARVRLGGLSGGPSAPSTIHLSRPLNLESQVFRFWVTASEAVATCARPGETGRSPPEDAHDRRDSRR